MDFQKKCTTFMTVLNMNEAHRMRQHWEEKCKPHAFQNHDHCWVVCSLSTEVCFLPNFQLFALLSCIVWIILFWEHIVRLLGICTQKKKKPQDLHLIMSSSFYYCDKTWQKLNKTWRKATWEGKCLFQFTTITSSDRELTKKRNLESKMHARNKCYLWACYHGIFSLLSHSTQNGPQTMRRKCPQWRIATTHQLSVKTISYSAAVWWRHVINYRFFFLKWLHSMSIWH